MTEGEARAARERLAAIGEIAAEVAHELRNVLQIISASAYVAKHDPASSGPHIAKIERNARLAHAIVDDLMSLARGDATQAHATLLADVVVGARADIDAGAASWVDTFAPADVRARVHPGLAARLFHALYENAIAVSAPRAPVITTRAWTEGAHVVVEVHDDGPGVAPEIAPRIFEPLVTARVGGTGLGLALARRIAAANDATIELVTGGEGDCGATFRVVLCGPS